MRKKKSAKQYDAIQLCDGMTILEVIRAVTIMPANGVLRLPVVDKTNKKLIRLRVEFEGQELRPWLKTEDGK